LITRRTGVHCLNYITLIDIDSLLLIAFGLQKISSSWILILCICWVNIYYVYPSLPYLVHRLCPLIGFVVSVVVLFRNLLYNFSFYSCRSLILWTLATKFCMIIAARPNGCGI
jgi:hypothetical protein